MSIYLLLCVGGAWQNTVRYGGPGITVVTLNILGVIIHDT
jgi:hypothetical protein